MRRALPAVCLVLALALSSCAPQKRTASFFAMDTFMELTVYGEESVLDDTRALIERLEGELSVTDPDSEIRALNQNGTAELGEDARSLLERALEICALTGGALDITVYPVVRAWGFTVGEYRVPEPEEIAALLEKVDYTRISDLTLPEGFMVDLGAVAKGRASDEAVRIWGEAGVKSGLMSLGGSVYAMGTKPDGSRWRVGIRDPFSDGLLAAVEVEDRAVVTSGGYERYFEENGERYHHIIDPKTGYPARSGLASVTVIGGEGTLCDGLSTAFYVMGLERALELWRSARLEVEAVFVTEDGEITVTEGLEGSFEPLGDYKNAEIKVVGRG